MRYVRYVGLAHQRMITAQDWRSARFNNADTVVWNAYNGFAVPIEQFTDDQIKKVIDPDPNFVVTAEDEEFEPTPQTRDMTPREMQQAVENPVDVPTLIDQLTAGSATDSTPSTDAAPNGGASTDQRDEIMEDQGVTVYDPNMPHEDDEVADGDKSSR